MDSLNLGITVFLWTASAACIAMTFYAVLEIVDKLFVGSEEDDEDWEEWEDEEN